MGVRATSSSSEILALSIKEDLANFITERQILAHKEKCGIKQLIQLSEKQAEVCACIGEASAFADVSVDLECAS